MVAVTAIKTTSSSKATTSFVRDDVGHILLLENIDILMNQYRVYFKSSHFALRYVTIHLYTEESRHI